jgi:hypothetical protein
LLYYTVTDRNIAFSCTPATYYLLNFGDLVNTVHLLLTENIKRNNYIISLFNFKYKRQWINVIFLRDKHSPLSQFLKVIHTDTLFDDSALILSIWIPSKNDMCDTNENKL